jgi:hypothetical protein
VGLPTLITIELALVLELPAPVLAGRAPAARAAARRARAIVRIQVDVLGVIDFDRARRPSTRRWWTRGWRSSR